MFLFFFFAERTTIGIAGDRKTNKHKNNNIYIFKKKQNAIVFFNIYARIRCRDELQIIVNLSCKMGF